MKKQELLDSLNDIIWEIDNDEPIEAKEMLNNLITEIEQYDINGVGNCLTGLTFMDWWNDLETSEQLEQCLKHKINYPDMGEIKHMHLYKD